jgi:LPXTG-site transpeptidase (sortase) family protein
MSAEPTSRDPRASRDETPGRGRNARVLAWIEWSLIALGFVCLSAYGVACANRSYYQTVEEDHFEEEVRQALAVEQHDQAEWSKKRVGAFQLSRSQNVEARARLTIPAAGLSVMVLEGTDETTLDRAVGRIPGTAEFDQSGNLGIAGHRDGFFRGLRHVAVDDEITLSTLKGVTRYRISELQIVEPEDVEVLEPTPDRQTITLVTCHPFYFVGSAPQRFIVHGEQVSFEPWTRETAAAFLGNSVAAR